MRRRETILTNRGQACLSAGVVLLVTGVLLGFPDITRIALLLLLLSVLALFMARGTPTWLRVTREVAPTPLSVGERAQVTIRLSNAGSRTSVLLAAQEDVPYALGDRPRFLVPALAPGEVREVHYPIRSALRGRFPVGPLSVRVRDGFGLTNRLFVVAGAAQVVVRPRVVPLAAGAHRADRSGTDGVLANAIAVHGEDAVAIRDYRLGDDLRRVHWPATAHRGALMVRQEERPTRRRAVVVLDTRASTYPGAGPRAPLETAVSAAASIVVHLLERGYDTMLVTDRRAADHSAAGPVTVDAALDQLALVGPGSDEDFATTVHVAGRLALSGGLVVAIVGAYGAGATGVRELAGSRGTGQLGIALLLDGPAFERAGRDPGDGSDAAAGSPAPDSGRAGAGSRDSGRDAAVAACTAEFTRAGWRVAVIGPRDNLAQVWAGVAGGHGAQTRERVAG